MPTDLPPDYKPTPPKDGDDARDPGTSPAGPAVPGAPAGDVVDGSVGGVPQPGPATGPGLPGGVGGDVVSPGLPAGAAVF